MPFPNEHSCRLKSPGDFKPESFRRTTRDHDGKEYSIVIGRLKDETTMTEQAYRYDKTKWTESQAKTHCEGHDGTFEPASEIAETHKSETKDWIRIAKVGQVNIKGEIITKKALEAKAGTLTGGRVTINHKVILPNLKMPETKFEDPFLVMRNDYGLALLFRESDSSGWSAEFDNSKYDGKNLIDFSGGGISILYPPHTPACRADMGCYEKTEDGDFMAFSTDFVGKILSAKNESELKGIAENIKKGFERLWTLLKSVAPAIEPEVNNQENLEKKKMEEKEKEELTSKFEATMKAKVDELTTTYETEVKELKERVVAFEKKEADETKARLAAGWEAIKLKIPEGLTHKEEDEKKLRAEFEQSPHEFMLKLISFERRETTPEEGHQNAAFSADDIKKGLDEIGVPSIEIIGGEE